LLADVDVTSDNAPVGQAACGKHEGVAANVAFVFHAAQRQDFALNMTFIDQCCVGSYQCADREICTFEGPVSLLDLQSIDVPGFTQRASFRSIELQDIGSAPAIQ